MFTPFSSHFLPPQLRAAWLLSRRNLSHQAIIRSERVCAYLIWMQQLRAFRHPSSALQRVGLASSPASYRPSFITHNSTSMLSTYSHDLLLFLRRRYLYREERQSSLWFYLSKNGVINATKQAVRQPRRKATETPTKESASQRVGLNIEWRQAKLRVEAKEASKAMTSIGVDQCYIPIDRRKLALSLSYPAV